MSFEACTLRRLTSGSGAPRRILPVSRPQPSGRPHDRAHALIEAERHQFPFVVAADQRVIGLVGDIARQAIAIGNSQRLHQMPAGEIRYADIADLAGADQIVERRQHFFGGVFAS